MIRPQEPELEPYVDHSTWVAKWSEDEVVFGNTPPGYRQDLVCISQVKRLLLEDMPPDLRLSFLELLNKYVHDALTLEAMQRVEPACDMAMKMLDEMQPLSVDDKSRLMRKWNVMAAFCNLNPSLIEAMKLFSTAALYVNRRELSS